MFFFSETSMGAFQDTNTLRRVESFCTECFFVHDVYGDTKCSSDLVFQQFQPTSENLPIFSTWIGGIYEITGEKIGELL